MSREDVGKRIWFSGYRFLAGRMDRVLPFFKDLRPSLFRSGLKISLDAYVSFIVSSSLVAFTASFATAAAIGLIYGFPLSILVLLGLSFGLLGGSVIFITFYKYPSIKAGSLGRTLDEELPYVLSYISVLATAGANPKEIIRSLALSRSGDSVTDTARTTVRDMDFLGYDLVSALEATRERVPSKSFREFLEGYLTTVKKGGDLKSYLATYGKTMMTSKVIAVRQFGETIAAMAEMYVILLVVFPLLIVIMFSVMALVSGTIAGLDIDMLMSLVTYILIPIFGATMLIMLDAIMPRGE